MDDLPTFRIMYLHRGTVVKGIELSHSGFYAVGENRDINFGPYEDEIEAGKAAREYLIKLSEEGS